MYEYLNKDTKLFRYWMVIQAKYADGWSDLGAYSINSSDEMIKFGKDIKEYRDSLDVPVRSVRRKELRPKNELMRDCGLTEEEADYRIEKYRKKKKTLQ